MACFAKVSCIVCLDGCPAGLDDAKLASTVSERDDGSRLRIWSIVTSCDRYCRAADKQQIADVFHTEAHSDKLLPPGYNIAPSVTQPIIRQSKDTTNREILGMR